MYSLLVIDNHFMTDRRVAFFIFASLLLAYTFFFPHRVDWNQNVRFDLTAAIVQRGTLMIDDYVSNTGDYALIGGHIYSDKAPGLSLLGVPVYAAVHPLTRSPAAQAVIDQVGRAPAAAATFNRPSSTIPIDEFTFMADVALLTFFTVALPSALLAVVLYVFLGWLGYAARWRALAVLVYGLATPVLTYSATLYGHQLAAALLFAAFTWLFRFRQRAARWWEAVSIGMLLGAAIITEYPAILIAAIIGFYAVWRLRRPFDRIVWLIGGGVVPLLIQGLYNAEILGTPFALPYQYVANPRLNELVNTGLLSAGLPKPEALWGLSFSPFRGLFFSSPILLLALPGLILLRRSVFRAEWIISLASVLSFFVLISASAQWWGGWSAGPRYLIPMLPFLVWPLTETLDHLARLTSRWRRGMWVITIGLLAISLMMTWALTAAGQYYLPDDVANPLIVYAWPHLTAGDVARNWGMIAGLRGAWSLLPLLGLSMLAFGAVWFVSAERDWK